VSIRTRFFAAIYDRQMRKVEKGGLTEMRSGLLAQAAGTVLEIGGGTGANLCHYGPQVTSLTVTEPNPSMVKRLERRAQAADAAVLVIRAPAEDLPFETGAFDTVVSTLVLCGVDDQPRAVREIRRVLRPGGHLLFLEHVRAADEKAARKQDRLNWLNRAVVLCDCNRPTVATLEDGGFRISTLAHTELPKAPSFVRPTVVGSAVAPVAGVPVAAVDPSVVTTR